MTKYNIFFLLFFIATIGFSSCTGQTNNYKPDPDGPEAIPGYVLAWHDEFNKSGKPNPDNWRYENGFVRNKELQWYQPDNAHCKNGVLVIEGKREKVLNPHYKKDSKHWKLNRKYAHYTSTCIETSGLQQFHYGRIIVRARIDTTKGSWPAIWTLGTKGRWPLNGEVDVMEFYRWHEKPIVLANACWGKGVWSTTRHPLSDFMTKDPEWNKKFHIWRMDWNKDSINLYLDNRLMNSVLLKNTINPDGSNPFHQPQFLLLNLAIGATGGDPSHSKFPIKYEVDYVRYYKQQ